MNIKSGPFVSVVTPVYNTEKYLKDCIESVIRQNYDNWEYIIVNNLSTDRSLEIAQHYAQKDSRIRIHSNENFLDQLQNWNHAMRQISPESKYCKVVHADDWLFPECVSKMVAVAEAFPSVGIVGAYRLDENEVNLDGLPYNSTFVSGSKVCKWQLLGGQYIFGSPTSLLFRSEIVRSRGNFYDESNIHADQEVCFDVLQNADFGFVHQVLTYTRRHNEALTAYTRCLDTYRVGKLKVLKKYGPVYLSRNEYKYRLKRMLNSYHKFLAKSILELRSNNFWSYHKNALANLGHPINKKKLSKALLKELLNTYESYSIIKHAIANRKTK